MPDNLTGRTSYTTVRWDSYDVFIFVKYLPKDSILYIRCPLMNSSYIKYYKKEITKLNNQPIKKVVIDIRSNYGGNDDVWIALLRQIIDKPFKNTIFYLSKNNNVCYQYANDKGLSKKNNIINPIWDLTTSYNVALNITEEIKPFRNSLNFTGNLYVLQDEEIYSSASCFSTVCLNYDKLISIGSTNGKIGGQGIEPMPFKLPNSKMIIQMDIFIDNSNAKTAKDVYHSEVEIPVILPIEYYIDREKYYENIPLEEYLYKHDILFNKVLELK